MIRTALPNTLSIAMPCRLHQGLGRAVVLAVGTIAYRFGSHKSINKSSFTAISEWLNSDQSTQSGRCRANLTPT